MKKILLSLSAIAFAACSLNAQTRYVDEVYSDEEIDIAMNIPYSSFLPSSAELKLGIDGCKETICYW